MPLYRFDITQRSEEWDRARLGIPTASEFNRIVTPTGKLSSQSDGYLNTLLAEWVFGGPLEDPQSDFRSQWMERGAYLEQQARQSYEFETGSEIRECGIILTDDGRIGASPDGLVGDDGILEMKCPSPKVHIGYMRTGSIEQDYLPQIQGLLYVSDRLWVDVQSYCPAFPTTIIRVARDEKYIALLRSALTEFCVRLEKAKADLALRFPTITPAARRAKEEASLEASGNAFDAWVGEVLE